jgi:pantetheine-phosphate adenylyltransferase
VKCAVYAGSFDPWSFGHQYVLDSALRVFDCVHVVAAINPAKKGSLTPLERARIIALAIEPFGDWWHKEPPYHLGQRVVVTMTTGLVVDYSREHGMSHLIRGLRSTSDFEAEFNLYFSNRAIDSGVETWAIMCPPELLHCSSTFVKTVVGRPNVPFVGTTFLAQVMMLSKPRIIGELFDLIQACSEFRFDCRPADLKIEDLNAALQYLFIKVFKNFSILHLDSLDALLHFEEARNLFTAKLQGMDLAIKSKLFPEQEVSFLWALLCWTLITYPKTLPKCMEICEKLRDSSDLLGKTAIPLIDAEFVKKILMGCELDAAGQVNLLSLLKQPS